MAWKSVGLVLAALGWLCCAWPAAAGEGNLDLGPSADWAQPLSDSDLAELRGGFGGFSFSVAFTGFFDNLGAAQGFLTVDTNGTGATSAPPPVVNVNGNQVSVVTSIGNFQGASGIFLLTSVPGSFNIVNNNLFVQIVLVNSGSPIPSLSSLLK